MAYADTLPKQRPFGQTTRPDAWWVQPLFVFLGFAAFIVYSTWAAFQGNHYWLATGGADYISPFYSPEIWGNSPHAIFHGTPGFWPSFIPFSPALLILWAPGGFRFTCYYYRGAYYKAFWADPINCAVGEPRKTYLGEKSFPLIIQNVHRYFLYIAIGFILLLGYDAMQGDDFHGRARRETFRHRRRHADHVGECFSVEQLHVGLPFAAASGRRIFGLKSKAPSARKLTTA